MSSLYTEVRSRLRSLVRSPWFACSSIAILGLGIGLNAAVFATANVAFFRPLPVQQPEQLLGLSVGARSAVQFQPLSFPEFLDYQEGLQAEAPLLAYRRSFAVVDLGIGDQISTVEIVSPEFFEVLQGGSLPGARITRRDFVQDPAAIVISSRFWGERLGSDAHVVGRMLRVNGREARIAGVMAPDFSGALRAITPDIWLPVTSTTLLSQRDRAILKDRSATIWWVLTRISNPAQAIRLTVAASSVATRLKAAFPETNVARDATLIPNAKLPIMPEVGNNAFVSASALFLTLTGLVLLLAIVNVAGLFLARAQAQSRDNAIRMSLGAGRLLLIRPILVDAIILSTLGSLLGLGLTAVCNSVLEQLLQQPPTRLNLVLAMDWRVVTYTVTLSFIVGLLLTCLSAWRIKRTSFNTSVEGGTRVAGRKVHSFVVVSQLGVSVLLLVLSSLGIRSWYNAYSVETGLNTSTVTVSTLGINFAGMDNDAAYRYANDVIGRVRELPDVRSVSLARIVPLSFNLQVTRVRPPASTESALERLPSVDVNELWPGYFDVLGIAITAGSDCGAVNSDRLDRTMLVSEQFARRYFPAANPVGLTIDLQSGSSLAAYRIIGVAADTKYRTIGESPRAVVYVCGPLSPQVAGQELNVLVRTTQRADAFVDTLNRSLASASNVVPIFQTETFEQRMGLAYLIPKAIAAFLVAIGLLALTLALVGFFGLVSYRTSLRARELAIRAALGASHRTILLGVMKEGWRVTFTGAAVGLLISAASGRLLTSMFYGLRPIELDLYATIVLLTAITATVATLPTALRAARRDPLSMLKSE